jgi:hypothetical protein
MLGLVKKATGLEPIVVRARLQLRRDVPRGTHARARENPVRDAGRASRRARSGLDPNPERRLAVLYLRPSTIPWTYITVFLLVGTTAGCSVRRVFGATLFSRGRFDSQMFLLGAAFLLLETRAVTQLSLLFGSTWIVNTSVFGGVLVMVLAANAVAARTGRYRRELWYAMLALSLIALWVLPLNPLFEFDLTSRAAIAGLAVAVPIFFAGIIFSSELRSRSDAAAALGSNLCGAVVGGLLENLSMLTGLKAVVMLALVFYLPSMLVAARRAASAAQPA